MLNISALTQCWPKSFPLHWVDANIVSELTQHTIKLFCSCWAYYKRWIDKWLRFPLMLRIRKNWLPFGWAYAKTGYPLAEHTLKLVTLWLSIHENCLPLGCGSGSAWISIIFGSCIHADLYYSEKLQRFFRGSQMVPWRTKGDRGRSKWRLKMEPWRVCRTVVADSHHFDEEQYPARILIRGKSWIRIRIRIPIRICIKVQIHTPATYRYQTALVD
jgi:hypothetical protein